MAIDGDLGSTNLDGKLTVETPEQVGIEFELAGAGSRFLAALIDLLCMLVFLVGAIVAAISALSGREPVLKKMGENAARSESWTNGLSAAATILLLLAVFLVQWGYYIICEMLMKGASPGKRALGLRVIRDTGVPIGFTQSLLRNLVRIVDFLPWGYGVGLVTMFASPRAQRLGDLAAGTLVVRVEAAGAAPPALPGAPAGVGRLSARERNLISQFLGRARSLDPEARDRLAHTIAAPLRARLGEPSALSDEHWLGELLSRELRP